MTPSIAGFGGGINIEQIQIVRLVKGRSELVEQMPGAGKAVRLKQNQNAAVWRQLRRCQRGLHFRGMMSVIIDHGHPVLDAAD